MKKIIKILISCLVILSILLLVTWQSGSNGELQVYFFDVGQGDAILIRTPAHQNIVIDGGPDNSFITKLGQTLPFYDKTVDLMILTHPHDDHLFGLVEVLKRYQVRQVLYSGVLHTTDAYLEWLQIIKEKKIPLRIASAGQKYVFNEVELKVIYPFKDYTNQKVDNLHDSMVVVQLIYHDIKIVFTGDLEEEGEREVIQHFSDSLQSQVLKVGHHGSDTSSSWEFLDAVGPKFAIIQVGADNKFGHPSKRVLKRFEKLGIEVYRNDLLGDIVLITDGQGLWVKSHTTL